jgi:hypothetical protein
VLLITVYVLTNKKCGTSRCQAQTVMMLALGVFPLAHAVAAMLFCNGHKISSRSFRVAAASMPLFGFDVAN